MDPYQRRQYRKVMGFFLFLLLLLLSLILLFWEDLKRSFFDSPLYLYGMEGYTYQEIPHSE